MILSSQRSRTAFRIKIGKNSLNQPSNFDRCSWDKKSEDICKDLKNKSSKYEETNQYQSSLKKKIHLNQFHKKTQYQTNQPDFQSILKVLNEQQDNYFNLQDNVNPSRKNGYNLNTQEQKKIVFPDSQLKEVQQSKNQLLKRTIQIMSNKNQKIAIPIHQGLYKSNTSHKNNQYFQEKWNQIPNICDFKTKNQYSQSIQFIREYKSGYAPIEMQKRNNDEPQEDKQKQMKQYQSPVKGTTKDKSRSHFIRKQQSTLTLPRTCGVSYIKPSESDKTQKLPFQPLPPLIFQGSTTCSIGTNQYQLIPKQINIQYKQLINTFVSSLQNSWISFVISNQDEMRSLLLGKRTKNAKVGFVYGIQNLWPLFIQGSFILIFITSQSLSTQKQVWKVFQNKQSYFRIGILSKKSTSGRKAFLKSIKGQASDTTSITSQDTKLSQIRQFQIGNSLQKIKSQSFDTDIKEIPQQQKKTCNTFELLEQQLKDNRTVITMSLRLQMYVQQMDWKQKFTRQNKEMLNQIIMGLKDRLEKKSIKVIQERFQYQRDLKNNYFIRNFDFLRMPNDMEEYKTQFQRCQQNQRIKSEAMNNFLCTQKNKFQLNSTNQMILFSLTKPCSPADLLRNFISDQSWKKSLKFPLYYISTRDSFAFDLIQKTTILKRQNGRQYTKIEYYFYPDNIPTNFGSQYRKLFPQFDVGVTAYHDFFTEEQMKYFQENTFQLERKAFKNQFLQMTVQPSIVSTKIKRTKFFFGYRYMWTRCQLSQPCSYVGAGVRKDVNSAPLWTKKIQEQMVKENMVQKDFLNSIAINVYHDGKQGLAQHFDDAVRFKQPIYTLRLFSDARLSFGSQFYGFCNGAFIIPLPRGCILVMQQNSYAANGVKHCVRPCDMTGKSAAIILRQMHSQVVNQASKYDQYIDFPAWLSCLSDKQTAISYAEQKRLEAEHIMKGKIE